MFSYKRKDTRFLLQQTTLEWKRWIPCCITINFHDELAFFCMCYPGSIFMLEFILACRRSTLMWLRITQPLSGLGGWYAKLHGSCCTTHTLFKPNSTSTLSSCVCLHYDCLIKCERHHLINFWSTDQFYYCQIMQLCQRFE